MKIRRISVWVVVIAAFGTIAAMVSSCGKSGTNNAVGLRIRYHILNLSPDILPVNLYINYVKVNSSPYIYGYDQGYFYISSTDTPFQIRSARFTGTTLLTRADILKPNISYSLFIVGALGNNTDTTIFTVDTATIAANGYGKLRFINASPSAGGLDVYANGTLAFKNVPYKKLSAGISLPAGGYDLQVVPTGSSSVLKDIPSYTILNGGLYTLYTYGYTTRTDTAAFNAAVIATK